MSTRIFVNLPVKDLDKAMAFFTALGWTFNPQFTDDNAACMVVNDQALVMLLAEPFFQGFTSRTIADTRTHAEGLFGPRVATRFSSPRAIADGLAQADIVIGAVQVSGRHTPRLISRALLQRMPQGSVLVDVAIDQGGIAETSRPTTHSAPFFIVEGIVHYCVTNMPGAVARTATDALTHATLPYVRALAARGLAALDADAGLQAGLQVHAGKITHAGLAQDLGIG